jgi:hypothetical protein
LEDEQMTSQQATILAAAAVLAAWATLVAATWATGDEPIYVNPPVAGVELAFMEGAQRAGGIVGDQDDNGVQDRREPGWRQDRGWWRDWNPFSPPGPRIEKGGASQGAPRAGRSDHGGHERG